jgi:hypothetical protein
VAEVNFVIKKGLTVPKGSASTPAIIFDASDPNTGIYSPAADELAISTNGTGRLFVDASGNVGVGTASPSSLLDLENDGPLGIRLKRIGANPSSCSINNAGNLLVLSHNVSGIQFDTGSTPTERARIDGSGRLLVGTSTALTTRLITTTLTPSFQVKEGGGGSALFFCGINAATPATVFAAKSRGTSYGTIVQNNDGLLRISAAGDDGVQATEAARIDVAVDGTPGADDMPGRLVFSTTADGASSPTERMRITSSGRVSIGTTSSRAQLDIGFDPASTTGLALSNAGTGTSARFYSGASIVGSIAVTASATAYNTSSDYRLKENVVPLTGAADRLNQLQVHRFNFIADPSKTVDGFIAHEAQAIVPECVTGTKDEVDDDGNPVYQGIDQSKLVPLLTAALQEALAEIESLKARVTALEP